MNPYAQQTSRDLISLAMAYAMNTRSIWRNAKYNKGTDEHPDDVHMIPVEIHGAICAGGPGAVILHDELDQVVICGMCNLAVQMEEE